MEGNIARVLPEEKTEETRDLVPAESTALDLGAIDPGPALRTAETIVAMVAKKCVGPKFIAPIQGKNYPKVEWWTTVGAVLGLFPREESNVKLARDGEVAFEATVGVYRGDKLVTRASAICSSREKRWGHADEYAVRSMASTRATGKAYRIGLSFLAVMAGLEATPAEEIPPGGFDERPEPLKAQTPRPVPTATSVDVAELRQELALIPEQPTVEVCRDYLRHLLTVWPNQQRDKVIQVASHYTGKDGKEHAIKSVASLDESYERGAYAGKPVVSDKWCASTLEKLVKRAWEVVNQAAEPSHADA